MSLSLCGNSLTSPSIVSRVKEYRLQVFGRMRKPNSLPVLPETIKYMLLMVFGSTYTALAGMFATSPRPERCCYARSAGVTRSPPTFGLSLRKVGIHVGVINLSCIRTSIRWRDCFPVREVVRGVRGVAASPTGRVPSAQSAVEDGCVWKKNKFTDQMLYLKFQVQYLKVGESLRQLLKFSWLTGTSFALIHLRRLYPMYSLLTYKNG